jgi:hypothetical protein
MADIPPELLEQARHIFAASSIKKSPGRPPKNPSKIEKLEKQGICAQPLVPTNIAEMKSDMFVLFKHIITYFKKLLTAELYIRFSPTHLIISCIDHMGNTVVISNTDATMFNSYYVKNDITAIVSCQDMVDIFRTVTGKDTTFISFYIDSEDDTEFKVTIGYSGGNINNHTITMQPENKEKMEIIKNKSEKRVVYDLSFKINSASVKNIKATKSKQSDITISYMEKWRHIKLTNEGTTNPETMLPVDSSELSTTISGEKLFSRAIKTDFFTKIAAANLSDKIKILCNENSQIALEYIIHDKWILRTITD